MKTYLLAFIAAFIICAVLFLALDAALLNLQGLSLVFHG